MDTRAYEAYRHEQWGLPDDRAGAWPTTQQLKAQHLAHVTRELEELKQQQEWADLEDQWATMEKEDKR